MELHFTQRFVPQDLRPVDITDNTIQQKLVNKIVTQHNEQLDHITKIALHKKGFDFDTKDQLTQFVKKRCTCEDYIHSRVRKYYIDNQPFLLYNYKVNVHVTDDPYIVKAQTGYYKFL